LIKGGDKEVNNQEIRAAILEAAYKAAREAGSIKGGIFSVYEISKDWGEEKKKIEFNACYLNEKDLVIWVESGGGMRITAAGVDEYERIHDDQ